MTSTIFSGLDSSNSEGSINPVAKITGISGFRLKMSVANSNPVLGDVPILVKTQGGLVLG